MLRASTLRPLIDAFALAGAGTLLGLFALPLVYDRVPGSSQAKLWLAATVVVCLCLIVPTRPLAAGLAAAAARLPGRGRRPAATPGDALAVAQPVIAAVYLIVVQAMLRRPIVAVFGIDAEPFVIEATFGVLGLLLLLVLLSWIHRTAKPLIESATWLALDATLATSGSDQSTVVIAPRTRQTKTAAATMTTDAAAATVERTP